MGWLPGYGASRPRRSCAAHSTWARLDSALSDHREGHRRLPVTSAILDGEAVVEDERGIPSFSALQAALGVREARSHPGHKAAHEAVYYAFDLLGWIVRTCALARSRSAAAPSKAYWSAFIPAPNCG
jgi:hypothetical protein